MQAAKPSNNRVKLFHGTDKAFWPRASGVLLYLSTSLEDAWEYAYESAVCRELKGFKPQPIVFSLFLDELPMKGRLYDDGGFQLSRNDWRTSLREKGSIRIPNSSHLSWQRASQPR